MAAEREAERAERLAQQEKMAEIVRFMQRIGAQTGVTLPAALLAPPPPPPVAATPVSVNVYCFRFCFASIISTFLD